MHKLNEEIKMKNLDNSIFRLLDTLRFGLFDFWTRYSKNRIIEQSNNRTIE
jgi:hypothetical protein